MPEYQETAWATVGKVVAHFGVRGELKVRLYSDIPDRFAELKAVYLEHDHSRHLIQHARPYKTGMCIIKLQGFDDANAAEALCNTNLLIPFSELPALPLNSYYQHDILGLQVYTLDDVYLGRVVDIITTGGNDVYVVKSPQGSEQLIPAIRDVIKQIDLIRYTMHIDPIPGLLDNSDSNESEEGDEPLEESE